MPACDAREVLLDKPYALAVEQAETALRTSARTGLASDGIDRMPQLGFYSNGKLAAAICVSSPIQIAAVVSPFGQKLLATTTLSTSQWGIVLTMSLFTVTVVELSKLMLKHK